MMLQKVYSFVRLTRPLFLIGGIILYLLGALFSWNEGAEIRFGTFVLGQFLVTAIQLMTHYANEYYDIACDSINTERTWFSGGSGVISAGAVSPRSVHRAAMICGAAAVVAGAAGATLWVMLAVLGIGSLLLAWSYSGPPLVLARSGWGELSASIVVAFLVPLTGYAFQTFHLANPALALVCLPLVLIHFAMLLAFQFPDQKADETAGKRTLTVRLGTRHAAHLHNLALLLAFGAILALSFAGRYELQFTWIALPLAAWQAASVHKTPHKQRFHWLTTGAISLFALTAGLVVVRLLLNWITT